MKENIRQEISVIPRKQLRHVPKKPFFNMCNCIEAGGLYIELRKVNL
jgi:hypothetical protein